MRVSSWCRLPPEGGQSVSRRSTRRDTPHRSDTRPKHREKLDFQRLVDDPPWGGRGRPLPGFDAVAPVTRRWTSVFFGHPSSLCPFCLQRVTRERERRGMSMKRVRSPEWRMPVQLIKPTLLSLQPRIWSFLSSDWWIGCLFSLLSLLSLSRPSKMWKLRILII